MFMYFNFYKTKVRSHSWPKAKTQLDRGSIRSSPWNSLSPPCRLNIRSSARLFHHVLFKMGDLHLVLPALNLSTLPECWHFDEHQVRLMMFSLNKVELSHSLSFLWIPSFML